MASTIAVAFVFSVQVLLLTFVAPGSFALEEYEFPGNVSYVGEHEGERGGAGGFRCQVPPDSQITDFAWSRSGEKPGGTYFPLSSISDSVLEKAMLGGAGPAKCVRMKWSDDDITVLQFYADPQKPSFYSCKQINPPKNAWDCTHLRNKDDPLDLSHTAYITLTDDKTFSFTRRCFPSLGLDTWVVFTTKPTLDRSTRTKILNHLRVSGLPSGSNELFERNYARCDNGCLP